MCTFLSPRTQKATAKATAKAKQAVSGMREIAHELRDEIKEHQHQQRSRSRHGPSGGASGMLGVGSSHDEYDNPLQRASSTYSQEVRAGRAGGGMHAACVLCQAAGNACAVHATSSSLQAWRAESCLTAPTAHRRPLQAPQTPPGAHTSEQSGLQQFSPLEAAAMGPGGEAPRSSVEHLLPEDSLAAGQPAQAATPHAEDAAEAGAPAAPAAKQDARAAATAAAAAGASLVATAAAAAAHAPPPTPPQQPVLAAAAPTPAPQASPKPSPALVSRITARKRQQRGLSEARMVEQLQGHEGVVWVAKFSGDGSFLATGGQDGVLRLWQAVSARCARVFAGQAVEQGSSHGRVHDH